LFVLDKPTTAPPVPAAPVSTTVPVAGMPPSTDGGATETLCKVTSGGGGGRGVCMLGGDCGAEGDDPPHAASPATMNTTSIRTDR
jgi:hypothetical protein